MYEELEQVRYEAFFDELGQMEKRAMLEKVAVAGSLYRAGRQLFRNPKAFGRGIKKSWQKGVKKEGPDAAWFDKGIGGLKQTWESPQGRLALGTAGAVGLTGAGYLAGRSSGGGHGGQNVYVR